MKRGLDWYKREPGAIIDAIRAAKMTDTQAAVYNLVLDLLYMTGGEQPNDARYIAAHFSNMGSTKARRTIDELVAMGKLTFVDGMLHQKRAENEAKTRSSLSETRASAGRLGGVLSGIARQMSKEINETDEAFASSKPQAEKRREERVVVGVDAREALLHRVLSALRLNPNDRLPTHWMPPTAEVHVGRWSALGLTDDEIVAVAEANFQRHGNAPDGPRALDRPMQRLAGEKRIEALTPAIPAPIQGGDYDRPRLQPARASRSTEAVDAFLSGASAFRRSS